MSLERKYVAGPSETHSAGAFARLGEFLTRRLVLCLFVATFVLPTTGAVLFYGFLAADRYVSEVQYIVRGVQGAQISGLSTLLRTFGVARSNDDSFVINNYVVSRDAVEALSRTIDLKAVYTRPEADWFTRFGTPLTGQSEEEFFKYYTAQVGVVEDAGSGITTLKISSYRAEDSAEIALRLMELGEARVNEINSRARGDALRLAQATLDQAADEVVQSQQQLTSFRNAESFLNPEDAASGNVEVIAALSAELSREEVRLRQIQTASPSNPNLGPVRDRISSLTAQIASERGKLTGSDEAISNKLGRYEELLMRRSLADQSFQVAANAIDRTRQEASRQQIYLEQVVRANRPDNSTEPRRLRMIFTVALLSISTFVMFFLLVSGSREHLNLN